MSECGEGSASVKIKEELKFDEKDIVPEADAIILYPSFGSPLLTKPKQPLRLLVLFERDLYELYNDEVNKSTQEATYESHYTEPGQSGPAVYTYKDKSNIKTPKTIEVINKALKVFPWANGKKCPRKLLFPSTPVAESKIKIHFIKVIGSISGDGRKLTGKDRKLVGLIRPNTLKAYTQFYYEDKKQKKDRGYFAFLFELEIHGLPELGNEGLYDCAWELHDPTSAANSMKPPLPLPERQDIIAHNYVKALNKELKHIGQYTGYKIVPEDKGVNKLGFEKDEANPLNHRHPIYVSNKTKLNIGQLTDIHISSRQVPMQYCEAQVLPGKDAEGSTKICSMINVSFNTFKDLLDQMGKDPNVDMLALTGDLIDFNQNFDPTSVGGDWKEKLKRPAMLWSMMDPDKFDEHKPYPFCVDMLTAYSLVHNFVNTHKKPVVMLTGNHEAYEKPYGISPRIGSFGGRTEGMTRANDGIPADHNLTSYEAALLYGPKYYDFRSIWNFEAKYLEWFYMLFTPLSDVTLRFGEQTITALEWEDDEQFIENKLRGGGTLPRATRAISDMQLELLREASKLGKERVLLTHFTIVNYGNEHQIGVAGQVNYSNNTFSQVADAVPLVGSALGPAYRAATDWSQAGASMSHFEEGTFVKNRKDVYNMLYDGEFTHVLSGHSHRAGLYKMTDKTGGYLSLSSNAKVQGYLISEKARSLGTLPGGGKACLIVGASGGPIACQNHYGSEKEKGFINWSLDYPSGNVLDLRENTLKLTPAKLDNAKPRFAVALGFFNDLNEPVFKKFESGTEASNHESEFSLHLHENLSAAQFIAGMKLNVFQVVVEGKEKIRKWESYAMGVTERGFNTERQRLLTAKVAEMDDFEEKVLSKHKFKNPQFLSIKFNKALSTRVGYTQYNYESPWIVPINLVDKKTEVASKANSTVAVRSSPELRTMMNNYVDQVFGYRIELSDKAPDFVWYQKTFKDNYGTDKPTSPPKDKEPGYTR